MLKSSGFQSLKNSKMSSECDRDVLFFSVESDKPILGFFLTVHRHQLLPVKILEFYPAHLCLLVTNLYEDSEMLQQTTLNTIVKTSLK
jgi:hypothetical protein